MAHFQNRIQELKTSGEQDPDTLFQLHQELNAARAQGNLTIVEFLKLDDFLTSLYPV